MAEKRAALSAQRRNIGSSQNFSLNGFFMVFSFPKAMVSIRAEYKLMA